MSHGVLDGGRGAVPGRAIAALEWAALACLVALFVGRGLVPAWQRVNTDFPNYYLAARLYHEGYPLDRLYDWVWFERQKDHAGIAWGPVGYGLLTPFSALVLVPLASLSALAAKRCWLCVNLVLLAWTLRLLCAMCRMPARRVALIAFAAVIPLRTNFEFGQQHVLLLFLLTAAAWLSRSGRDARSGAALALAAVLKIYPAAFAVFFLLKGRWRALAGLCAGVAVLTAGSVALLGLEPFRVYALSILPRALAGEGSDPYHLGNSTPTVLLRRIFVREPDLNPDPLAPCVAAYVVLQPLVQGVLLAAGLWVIAGRTCERSREAFAWGAFASLLLALSTASSTYHLCALILATVLGVDFLLATGRPRAAAVLAALHVLACLPWARLVPDSPPGWLVLLGIPRGYALLAHWGVFAAALAPSASARGRPREAIAFALGCLVIVGLGMSSNARRLAGRREETADLVHLERPTLIAAAPAVAPGAVYVSRLAPEGFLLDRTGSAPRLIAAPGLDVFAPAVASQAGLGWVELSSLGSRIVGFSLEGPVASVSDLPVEVEDAEQPGVSPDGRWLAFIRERQGRGSLWRVDRAATESAAGHVAGREVVDATHDVLDFAVLAGGRLVFSARDRGGVAMLSTVAPGPDPRIVPWKTARPARYPAVSPDGRWLVYGHEERGVWQLRRMDLETGEETALTHGECNATSPAWSPDGRAIVFASDCGRGVEQTALRRMKLSP